MKGWLSKQKHKNISQFSYGAAPLPLVRRNVRSYDEVLHGVSKISRDLFFLGPHFVQGARFIRALQRNRTNN